MASTIWTLPGSNRSPLPCHGSALPKELRPPDRKKRNLLLVWIYDIGMTRLERATPCSQSRCSSQLSYIPSEEKTECWHSDLFRARDARNECAKHTKLLHPE